MIDKVGLYMFTHILLEVYCAKNHKVSNSDVPIPFCKSENFVPEYNCLLNNCPFVMFTSHENALCYINQDSEATEIISLGNEMYKEGFDSKLAQSLWEKISKQKICEAYNAYMDTVNNTGDDTVISSEN